MPRAYCITAEAIAAERGRVGDDDDAFDFGRVIQLEEVELPALGANDVRLKILVASATAGL